MHVPMRTADICVYIMKKILIVDDSEMNRSMLKEMLEKEYLVFETENGKDAVAMLSKYDTEIDLVLLDIVMPEMDGIEVLKIMKKNGWLSDIPVIMISSEMDPAVIHEAYELGAMDFITRPFDIYVVQRRCRNMIGLYSKQKNLAGMVADQYYEREKDSRLMIDILAHIVEFRNNECGLHVVYVQSYTEILLRELMKITNKSVGIASAVPALVVPARDIIRHFDKAAAAAAAILT